MPTNAKNWKYKGFRQIFRVSSKTRIFEGFVTYAPFEGFGILKEPKNAKIQTFMKTQTRTIHIDQLYTQDAFLSFCNDDHSGSYGNKLGVKITPELLVACEKDDFLVPVYLDKETKYYSPFQIFIIAELCHNTVDEDGFLRDVDLMDLSYQKEHKTRYINWCGQSAFNINNRDTEKDTKSKILNQFSLTKDFNNFVRLIHSFKTAKDIDLWNHEKRRLYRHAPEIQFDFNSENDLKKILKVYKIDVAKVKTILKIVGNFALHIDPMEQWFNYIHKHPVRRKDEFKGVASVAQELYNICDIAKELIETVEQKELPPLLEFIKSDFPYGNRDKINSYAEGEDILAIKKACEDLTIWIKKNTKYLNTLFVKHPEWQKIDFTKHTKDIGEKLQDFYARYGDIRYVGSYRTIYPSDKKLDELDPETKRYVQIFSKSNDIHSDELQIEISQAISSRLSDLQREVSSVTYNIKNILENDVHRIEREKNMSVAKIQEKYNKLNVGSKKDQGLLASLFWREYLPKEQEVFHKELNLIEKLKSELYGIAKATRLVFCAKCREKHVIVHQLHYDDKLSNEAICDDCISKKDLQSIKSGEWRCEHENNKGEMCNALLYKFAHNNIMNTNLMNNSNATITLNFGQMDIQVKCKDCKNVSTKSIDWGWLA